MKKDGVFFDVVRLGMYVFYVNRQRYCNVNTNSRGIWDIEYGICDGGEEEKQTSRRR